jgi:hypothetical protein
MAIPAPSMVKVTRVKVEECEAWSSNTKPARSAKRLLPRPKTPTLTFATVESKFIEVDNAIADTEQRQALVALHRTLLHEPHDFLLAFSIPRCMPCQHGMWRHGTLPRDIALAFFRHPLAERRYYSSRSQKLSRLSRVFRLRGP